MRHHKDLGKKRQELLRADPRREPTIPPEAEHAEEAPSDDESSSRDIEVATNESGLEPPPVSSEQHSDDDESVVKKEANDDEETEPEKNPSIITNVDPRLEKLEPIVAAGNWGEVLKILGPPEQAGRLPPNLGLVYAIAAKEEHLDEKKQGGEQPAFAATEMAIRCMSGLMGVAPDSSVALLITKRMLRSNPVTWRQAPAPSGKVSALILVLAGIIGGGIGWFLSLGYVTVRIPWLH